MNEIFTPTVLKAIQDFVIIPSIVVLGTFFSILLKALSDFVVAKLKDNSLKKYIALATEAVDVAVNSTNQQFVDALKQSGEFSGENYKQAFEKSKEIAKAIISDEAEKIIGEAYKDFDVWLENQIYAAVRANKLIIESAIQAKPVEDTKTE